MKRIYRSVFDSGMMSNPFTLGHDDESHTRLLNIATGVVAPGEVSGRLLRAYTIGKDQMASFVAQRLNTNEVSFWDPLPHVNIKTFSSLLKKKKQKSAEEKAIIVSADRELFGRLLIAAKGRDIDLKHVLTFELSAVPFALAHADGTMRKTNKSVLLSELERLGNTKARLPSPEPNMLTTFVVDGMAMVQMVKGGGASTIGQLATTIYEVVLAPLGQNGCRRVDVVFDQYKDRSIKSAEHATRGTLASLEVTINNEQTPIPKQWAKYIGNSRNEQNLCSFLSEFWCKKGQSDLKEGLHMVIGGGFKDKEKCVDISKGTCEVMQALESDHEEADTRILLHAKQASSESSRVVIQSPDTDVMVLCITHFQELGCNELWFRTGVKNKLRYIQVHSIVNSLGPELCTTLPAYHALTGCDSTSSLSGIGKKSSFGILRKSPEHQKGLQNLGQTPSVTETTNSDCEKFICNLYTSVQHAGTTCDMVRYWLFCQKKQRNEGLPPTSDSMSLHIKRANYQTLVWRRALYAKQDLPDPVGNGWEVTDDDQEIIQPLWMEKDPAPKGLVELSTCHCAKSACRRSVCTCRVNGLSCTEACSCMAENCENPSNMLEDDDDDEAED